MTKLCKIIRVSRSSYYKWIRRIKSNSQIENEKVQQKILKIHDEVNKIYGYRRMTVAVNRELGTNYNEKRIRRIMRINHIQSIIRRRKANWVKSSAAHIAENILNRKFHEITKPNQVWCTDVTEFKCKNNRKIYLSAIIDLYDYSIISHVISNRNNNALVMDTLKAAFQANPSAKPLIHSDRGFQYTSHEYNRLKEKFGFKVSMS
ncbi:IS3 family transposase [Bacillus cereus]|uniref:IS3 family transposase n=1 Tax=Bacillus cereus TaxID=1396 RepID=UPI0003AB016F|nr:IS3 family transposase [Bacillus cereus]